MTRKCFMNGATFFPSEDTTVDNLSWYLNRDQEYFRKFITRDRRHCHDKFMNLKIKNTKPLFLDHQILFLGKQDDHKGFKCIQVVMNALREGYFLIRSPPIL